MNAFTLLPGVRQGSPSRFNRAPDPMQPPPLSSPSSALLLGDFASLLILVPVEAGAGKAEELDGQLFECCQAAAEADRAASRAMDGIECIPENDPCLDHALGAALPFLIEYDAAIRRAAELPARTPEGLRAKAGLLLLHLATEQDCEALAASLARDVAGRL